MSYGYNQYLYGNSSYRNPSIVNKNEEKQNLNQSSQFNIAGKMAIATTIIIIYIDEEHLLSLQYRKVIQ